MEYLETLASLHQSTYKKQQKNTSLFPMKIKQKMVNKNPIKYKNGKPKFSKKIMIRSIIINLHR